VLKSLFLDFLNPTALAHEWAFVYKPKIIKSLGIVTDFTTTVHKIGRVFYYGNVYDCEYKVEKEVPDDLWSANMKESPRTNSAVVLSWIELNEEYVIVSGREKIDLLFPLYIGSMFRDSAIKKLDYWLAWVDTSWSSSQLKYIRL
jgi:hypothetical protein